MLARNYRHSALVVDRWFGGLDGFIQLVGVDDSNHLKRMLGLTLELEAALRDSAPSATLYMRDGATPDQLYPPDSLPVQIYTTLMENLGPTRN